MSSVPLCFEIPALAIFVSIRDSTDTIDRPVVRVVSFVFYLAIACGRATGHVNI